MGRAARMVGCWWSVSLTRLLAKGIRGLLLARSMLYGRMQYACVPHRRHGGLVDPPRLRGRTIHRGSVEDEKVQRGPVKGRADRAQPLGVMAGWGGMERRAGGLWVAGMIGVNCRRTACFADGDLHSGDHVLQDCWRFNFIFEIIPVMDRQIVVY